jgi:hypothetical protein
VLKFLKRLTQLGLVAALGAAAAAKVMLKSNAEPHTQEVDMVAIYGGEDLVSVADPSYGGKILTIFGGTRLDLRHTRPAPTGVYLDLLVVGGGVELIVPKGWRVEFTGKTIAGGFDDATSTDSNPDAVKIHVGGIVAGGGVHITNKTYEEAAAE